MNVKESLDKLGNTTIGVATILKQKGIKGIPKEPDACPITNYLIAEGFSRVSTTEKSIWIGMQEHELPIQIRAFVVAFDHGEYPDLEQKP